MNCDPLSTQTEPKMILSYTGAYTENTVEIRMGSDSLKSAIVGIKSRINANFRDLLKTYLFEPKTHEISNVNLNVIVPNMISQAP